jgi:hypothetical protein
MKKKEQKKKSNSVGWLHSGKLAQAASLGEE